MNLETAANAADHWLLSGEHLSKRYGSVSALKDVSFGVRAGEVVGLVGDNGAGKSSLIRILSGAHPPTSGSLSIEGQAVVIDSPLLARKLGIETVHQGLALAPNLTVAENIFLGREEVVRGLGRFIGWLNLKNMKKRAHEDLARLSINLPSPNALCGDLSGGQRQAVAIARAVSFRPKVLMLDEPTAALGVRESAKVLDLIRSVQDQGIAVVLVSHNMQQVDSLCDRVLVLFQGALVAELPRQGRDPGEIVRWMTGAALVESGASN